MVLLVQRGCVPITTTTKNLYDGTCSGFLAGQHLSGGREGGGGWQHSMGASSQSGQDGLGRWCLEDFGGL